MQRTLSALCLVPLAAVGCTGGDGDSSDGSSQDISVIQNRGSDTMVNIAQAWAEEYKTVRPDVTVEVGGGGSGVGIRDLIQGVVDIASASRDIKDSEALQIKQNTGKEAKEHTVAFDGIGLYIHKDNPLDVITLEQAAGIYGENGAITKWSQLGVDHTSFCTQDEIVVVSRQSNSGTYAFFRELVLGKGDFRLGTRDMAGSKDVVDLVEHTPCAIGYSGMGYKTEGVKFLKVAAEAGAPGHEPTVENVLSKNYPIARALHMYTLGEPQGHVKEYLDWIHSPAGQKIVVDNGYVPLPSSR